MLALNGFIVSLSLLFVLDYSLSQFLLLFKINIVFRLAKKILNKYFRFIQKPIKLVISDPGLLIGT